MEPIKNQLKLMAKVCLQKDVKIVREISGETLKISINSSATSITVLTTGAYCITIAYLGIFGIIESSSP